MSRGGRGRIAAAVVAAVCCAASACTAAPEAPPKRKDDHPGVHAWVTDPQDGLRLADRGAVAWEARATDPDVVVENRRRYQQFFGVGASITGSSAVALDTLSADLRSRVMRNMFDRSTGAGLALLRQPVGSTDFSTGSYSYDDVRPGHGDPGLTRFSLGEDGRRVVPLLRLAADLNPSLAVVLSPWSAPAWMKTGGSLIGGSLRPEHTADYAAYLVKTAQAYLAAGVPVTGLTVQNEPTFLPPGYSGMTLDVEQQRRLIDDHLVPDLDAARLPLHVWALDDNFDRWPDADRLLSDPVTRAHVYGVAFHCYRGDVSALREIRRRHPGTAVSVSECSGGDWSPSFAAALRYEADTLLVHAIRNGAAWLSKWNLVLDETGGPTNGGCQDCQGLATVDRSTGAVTYGPAYYAWSHVGRFVTPGARVIGSTPPRGQAVHTVAFENPDGSHVLVAFNAGTSTREFRIGWEQRSFHYRLHAGALATFTW